MMCSESGLSKMNSPNYLQLKPLINFPYSARLDDEEIFNKVVLSLPKVYLENIMLLILSYNKNHPDTTFTTFLEGKSLPYGGEGISKATGYQVSLKSLPDELLHFIKIYISMAIEF